MTRTMIFDVFVVAAISGACILALRESYGAAVVTLLFVICYELGMIRRALEDKP